MISAHFFIGGIADDELGEKVILALKHSASIDLDQLTDRIKKYKSLEPFEFPKSIVIFSNFKETDSGKIRRKETLLKDTEKVLDL